jgi:hypothetical protein
MPSVLEEEVRGHCDWRGVREERRLENIELCGLS